MSKDTLTQAQRLGNKLIGLSVDVTSEDRIACTKELEVSKTTISNYLNGKIRDNDTAVSLITFFTKRIESRYNAIPK